MIFPVGSHLGELRRWPVVTIALVAALACVQLATFAALDRDRDDAATRSTAIIAQVQAHPWARLPAVDGVPPLEQIRRSGRPGRGLEPYYADLEGQSFEDALAAEEDRLERLALEYRDALDLRVVARFGFTPARPTITGALCYPWLGTRLIGLLLSCWLLYVFGIGVEDAFGRAAVPGLFLLGSLAGAAGLLAFAGPHDAPVIGALGGIGAVAGALLARHPGLKMRCFYWWQFSWGTLDLSAVGVLAGGTALVLLLSQDASLAGVVLGCGVAAGLVAGLAFREAGVHVDLDPLVAESDVSADAADAYRRGMVHLDRNNPALAVQALSRAAEIDPTSVSVSVALWRAIRAQGIPDRIVAWVEPRILEAIDRGAIRLALTRWREMVAVLGSDGPASVRAPLAAACAEFDPATAARLRAGLEREAAVRAAGPGEDTPAAWLAGEDDYVDLADDEEAPQESPTGPSPPGPAHPPAHRAPPLPDPGPGGAATRPADSLAQAGDDASRAVTDPGGMDLSSIPVPGDSGDVDGLEDTDVRIRDRPSRLGAHADASVATGGTVLGWRPSDEPDSAPRTQPPASRSTPRFRKLDVTRAKLVFIDGGVLQFHTGAELAADGVGSVAFGRVKTRSGHILILDLVTNWRRRQRSDSLQVVRLESRSTDAREVFGNPELDPTEAFARLARTIATLGHARMLPDAWAVPSAPIQDFASLAEFEATYARLGA